MLTGRSVSLAFVGLLLTTMAITVPGMSPAAAVEVPPGCWTEEYRDDQGFLQINIQCPWDGPVEGNPDGVVGPGATRECTYGAHLTIECETRAGVWNGSCYVTVADPQPAREHPAWGGRTDGVILQCTGYEAVRADCDAVSGCPSGVSYVWGQGPPGSGPSPERLARQVVARMQLQMGSIGSTPPEGTSESIVGMPIWLWVTNPAPNTTGPITTSASSAGLTVTVTATLDQIAYSMSGTGATVAGVTCAGMSAPGTAYEPTYGASPSPTCGITAGQNQHTGSYTITGTASWTAQWTGGGQTGTIPVEVGNSIQMEVGEVQSIRTGSG